MASARPPDGSARMASLPIVPSLTLIVQTDPDPPEMILASAQFDVQATSVGEPVIPAPERTAPG